MLPDYLSAHINSELSSRVIALRIHRYYIIQPACMYKKVAMVGSVNREYCHVAIIHYVIIIIS